MSPFLISSLLLLMLLTSSVQISQAKFNANRRNLDRSESSSSSDEQDRMRNLKALRHYLLTSRAEERAARREQGIVLRRQLIREYLDSLTDPDPNRFSEVQKRFNYCTDEEMMHDSLCRRRDTHY